MFIGYDIPSCLPVNRGNPRLQLEQEYLTGYVGILYLLQFYNRSWSVL